MSVETRHIVWESLRPLLRPHRRSFVWVVVLTLLGSGFGLVEPIVYREVVNDVSGLYVRHAFEQSGATGHPNADTTRKHEHGRVAARTPEQALSTLLWAVVILTLTGALSRLCYLAADTRSTRAASRVEQSLVLKTFEHVLRLPLPYLAKRGAGKLTRRVDQSDAVAPILTSFAQEFLPEVITFIGIFAVMGSQNWRLTLIALATVPPYLFVARLSSRRLEQTATAYYDQWDSVSAHLSESLSGVKTVKLSGAEGREVARLGGEMGAAYDSYVERNQAENRYANWQGILVQAGEALVLAIGGYYVLEHKMTPGDVVMFVTYLNQVYEPIDQLSSLLTTLQEHVVSVARAGRMLQVEPEKADGAALAEGPGRVEFRGVHFGYTPAREVLRGVSFVLEAGKATALVGPSGAGKTTSSDLLLRLFEFQAGAIEIDGQDIRELNVSSLRSAVAVVAVDGTLFNGSLADNIRYRRPSATDDEVREAAIAAGLTRALERLPQGLESKVGDQGVGLSAGERQRLQIARALVSRPRLLVLDEATANLDYATQLEVKGAIDRARQGSTTLIIAHRYSMVKDADHVIVLEGGLVTDQGTPAELLQRPGFFSAFAKYDANVVSQTQAGSDGVDSEDDDAFPDHDDDHVGEDEDDVDRAVDGDDEELEDEEGEDESEGEDDEPEDKVEAEGDDDEDESEDDDEDESEDDEDEDEDEESEDDDEDEDEDEEDEDPAPQSRRPKPGRA